MAYARNTQVSAERSRAEIERTLRRYGASTFGYANKEGAAMVEFTIGNRRIRFILPMPSMSDESYTHNSRGRARATDAAIKLWEQATRQKWRALALVVKAKLEAVESGITTLEQEFLAHIVIPGGKTVGDVFIPRIQQAYATGKVPALEWEGM